MIEPFEPRIARATFLVTSLTDSGADSLRAAIANRLFKADRVTGNLNLDGRQIVEG
jgi:hypothetical protein